MTRVLITVSAFIALQGLIRETTKLPEVWRNLIIFWLGRIKA